MREQLVRYAHRACAQRGCNRHKTAPRPVLAQKAQLRHEQRISAGIFGVALRKPALLPLISLQLRLSHHHYSRVRRLAQSGFTVPTAAL